MQFCSILHLNSLDFPVLIVPGKNKKTLPCTLYTVPLCGQTLQLQRCLAKPLIGMDWVILLAKMKMFSGFHLLYDWLGDINPRATTDSMQIKNYKIIRSESTSYSWLAIDLGEQVFVIKIVRTVKSKCLSLMMTLVQHKVKGVRLVETGAVQIASQTANITVESLLT